MLLFTLLFIASLIPLVLCAAGVIKTPKSRKAALAVNIIACFMVCILAFGTGAVRVSAEAPEEVSAVAESGYTTGFGIGLLGAALATGLSCIGAGIAVASSASAAIGAISENPKTFG